MTTDPDSFRAIIDSFPGPGRRAVAEAAGVKEGLVSVWYTRDALPAEYWEGVVRGAADLGIPSVTLERLARIAARRTKSKGQPECAPAA